MKKGYKIAAVLAVLIIALSACGSSMSADRASSMNTASEPTSGSFEDFFVSFTDTAPMEQAADASEKNSYSGGYQDGSVSVPDVTADPVANRDNTKVIYTAEAVLQTTEFDEACNSIRELTKQLGGYMENEYISNSSSSNTNRKGSFSVRVPAESYDQFISSMGEGCKVISIRQSKEDVGAEYFDIEQKLETLNNKHDRLEALLAKAEEMADIIDLEDALSETEYQINKYKGTLNRYDSLISFSTVNISLTEVAEPGTGIGEDPGFFERLGKNFSQGFRGFTSALEDLAYWFSYNLLTIIVVVVIIIVIVKIHPIRRIKKAAAKLNEPEEPKKQDERSKN